MDSIRIVIADDHEIFRNGFKLLFKNLDHISLIGEAENGVELLKLVNEEKPDIVITDIQMPEMNGIVACHQIKLLHRNIKVIALSTFNEDNMIIDMLEAGANAYLLKNTNKQELKEAIEAVYNGGFYYSEATSKKLARLVAESKFTPGRISGVSKFSEREIRIMQLICKQYSNKEIATELNLSVRTVESNRERIQDKTGSRNSAGIVVYAMKHNLFEFNE